MCFLILECHLVKSSTILDRLKVLTRLFHDLHLDLGLLLNLLEQLPLCAVNQAIVAEHIFADLALIDGAMSRVEALFAALSLLVVRL